MVRRQTSIPDEENALLTAVLEYAQIKHVLAMHPRPARTEHGWRTAIQGDDGYFDITMIGPGGILLVELKRRKGAKHSPGQLKWLEMAMRAKQVIGSPQLIVDTWTFDQWPDPGKTLIDTIAKAPAKPVEVQIFIDGDARGPSRYLPPRPTVDEYLARRHGGIAHRGPYIA